MLLRNGSSMIQRCEGRPRAADGAACARERDVDEHTLTQVRAAIIRLDQAPPGSDGRRPPSTWGLAPCPRCGAQEWLNLRSPAVRDTLGATLPATASVASAWRPI